MMRTTVSQPTPTPVALAPQPAIPVVSDISQVAGKSLAAVQAQGYQGVRDEMDDLRQDARSTIGSLLAYLPLDLTNSPVASEPAAR